MVASLQHDMSVALNAEAGPNLSFRASIVEKSANDNCIGKTTKPFFRSKLRHTPS
jgi:hypothetical protein